MGRMEALAALLLCSDSLDWFINHTVYLSYLKYTKMWTKICIASGS